MSLPSSCVAATTRDEGGRSCPFHRQAGHASSSGSGRLACRGSGRSACWQPLAFPDCTFPVPLTPQPHPGRVASENDQAELRAAKVASKVAAHGLDEVKRDGAANTARSKEAFANLCHSIARFLGLFHMNQVRLHWLAYMFKGGCLPRTRQRKKSTILSRRSGSSCSPKRQRWQVAWRRHAQEQCQRHAGSQRGHWEHSRTLTRLQLQNTRCAKTSRQSRLPCQRTRQQRLVCKGSGSKYNLQDIRRTL